MISLLPDSARIVAITLLLFVLHVATTNAELVISVTGSSDFASSVEWIKSGVVLSSTASLNDSPAQGDFRFDMSATRSSSTGSYTTAHAFFLSTTYDPSAGPIESISFTLEADSAGIDNQVLDILLRQNGEYYSVNSANPRRDQLNDGVFTNLGKAGVVATDFVHREFTTGGLLTGNPDFSSNGGMIEFGLAGTFFSGNPPFSQSRRQEVQNFSIIVTTAVPEPSTFFIVSLASAVMFSSTLRNRGRLTFPYKL